MTDTEVLPTDLAPPADGPILASWLRRVVAALLDGSILGGATSIMLGPEGSGPSLTPTFDVDATGGVDLVGWFTSPWLVGLLVAMLALQGWTGATPGKRVAGVAIVRATDGLPVGIVSSALRVVAHLLDAILLIGYLRPLWNVRKQTFADSIVGTLAVETREPPAHPWFTRFRREPSVWRSAVVNVAAGVVCARRGVLGVADHDRVRADVRGPVRRGRADRDRVRRRLTGGRGLRGPADVAEPAQPGALADRPEHRLDLGGHRPDVGPSIPGGRCAQRRRVVVGEHEQDVSDRSIAVLNPVTIPSTTLDSAGPGWTVESRLVSNGATVASCTVSQEDWDGAGQG